MSESEYKPDSLKKGLEESVASHYALQIALQTMKERCQLLQQRLSSVEDENLRLRIECQNNARVKNLDVPNSEISKLEEKITQLVREKSQLANRITMVSKENNQLWTRLSRLTEANQSLGNHLTKISDTLSKHPIGEASKVNESTEDASFGEETHVSSDLKEESLEEISLKIIDGIKREKKELEQQCEQMIKLQTGAVSVEDCGFALTAAGDSMVDGVGEEDGEKVMDDLRKLREKMKDEYKILKDQQAGLRGAITALSGFLSSAVTGERRSCKCKEKVEGEKNSKKSPEQERQEPLTLTNLTRPLDEIQMQLDGVSEPPASSFNGHWPSEPECTGYPPKSALKRTTIRPPPSANDEQNKESEANGELNYEDRICPLCSKFFNRKVPFDQFNDHVIGHFKNEDESDSIVANFEIIEHTVGM